MYPQGVVTFLT